MGPAGGLGSGLAWPTSVAGSLVARTQAFSPT